MTLQYSLVLSIGYVYVYVYVYIYIHINIKEKKDCSSNRVRLEQQETLLVAFVHIPDSLLNCLFLYSLYNYKSIHTISCYDTRMQLSEL